MIPEFPYPEYDGARNGLSYIVFNTGDIFYFPATYQTDTFAVQNGRIVNVTNSSVSGYLVSSGVSRPARVTSLGDVEYRVDSGYSYEPLAYSSIDASNVSFYTAPLSSSDGTPFFSLSFLFLLGVIVLCLFMRK